MTELGPPALVTLFFLLVLFLYCFWSFLPCGLVEIDRVFFISFSKKSVFWSIDVTDVLQKRGLPAPTSPCVRRRRRRGLGEAPSLGPRFRPLHRGPACTRLPPAPRPHPVHPLLFCCRPLGGGGARWEAVPSHLCGSVLWPLGFCGFVLSLLVVPGVLCFPCFRSVFGFGVWGCEFIVDVAHPARDCVFAAHGHLCFLVSEESSSGVWSEATRPLRCLPVLEGRTLQRVQCRQLALRPPGPCARATGAASPWGTVGVPGLAHKSLSPSTRGLQPPLGHGVSGQRGTGGLSGAPCVARPQDGTPGAPAVPAPLASGSRGRSGAAPCLAASKATGSSSVGTCRRPRGTHGHAAGSSRGQPGGPRPGRRVPKAACLLDSEPTLPSAAPAAQRGVVAPELQAVQPHVCLPSQGRSLQTRPPLLPLRPKHWSLGLGGGEGAAAPRGQLLAPTRGGGAGSAGAACGSPDLSRWG